VVRGPAAVLTAAFAGALAYLLIAPVLPGIGGTSDTNTLVSDLPTMLILGGCVLALVPARDEPFVLVTFALGAGMVAAAMTEAGANASADAAKVLFAGSVGMLLARFFAEPAIVIAVPVFVAAVDIVSVAGGPSTLLARDSSRTGEFLSLYLPAWGGGRAGVLGIVDFVFFAFFASAAWRFGLRRRATAAGLLLALPAAIAIQIARGGVLPALPLLAAGLLLPNLDLLPGVLRSQDNGRPAGRLPPDFDVRPS
jgi:hypothetical protein